ncbi:MAG: hypothetical protein E7391_07950 [Ruminococcaceae bacterium]|nr:hypothetical protein [Oscillospiraceae bacterium]
MVILKNYKRILTLVLSVCMVVMCFAGCSIKKNPISVGTINGIEITDDVYAYFMHVMEQDVLQSSGATDYNAFWDTKDANGKKGIDVLRESTREYIVSLCVLNAKAKDFGIALTEEEKAQIDTQIANERKAMGEKTFKEQLKKFGATEDTLKRVNELELIADKVTQKLTETDDRLQITDEEATAYITEKGYITAKHILFNTTNPETGEPLSDEAKAELKVVVQETLDKINSGEQDYDAVMNELSEDPGLQSNPDGYFFKKGEMVAPFEDAAYKLEVGQISEIVESDYGFHIIKRVEDNLDNAKQLLEEENFETVIKELTANAKVSLNDKEISRIKPIKY